MPATSLLCYQSYSSILHFNFPSNFFAYPKELDGYIITMPILNTYTIRDRYQLKENLPNSVAKGPKIRPQNAKGSETIVWREEKLGSSFRQIYKKKAEMGPNFLQ
jgi:hypothetical protein